jgi:glycosyltransferase involved in cell wall biosynthesis
LPGAYDVIPNGVLVPPAADPSNRDHTVVFIGRHDPRKGLSVLLTAWPEIHRRTGAQLRVVGADPLAVRLLLSRHRVPEQGIDVLGFLARRISPQSCCGRGCFGGAGWHGELRRSVDARVACAVPVVSSDIAGYRDVMTDETGLP